MLYFFVFYLLLLGDMALLNAPLFRVLSDNLKILETHFRDCVEVEFTVENNDLYFLETMIATRSPQAAIKIAMHMVTNHP